MKAKDLRNSILQLAVQGKLVPQDPDDEPASVLLERIRAERAKLIKEGKLKAPKDGESVIYRGSDGSHYEKRGKGEPVCIDDEIPFDIPESWDWARFETIADTLAGYAFKSSDFNSLGNYRLLRGINLGIDEIRWNDTVYVDDIPASAMAYKLETGDVLLGLDRPWISGGLRIAIIKDAIDTYLVQRVLRIRGTSAAKGEWLKLLLETSLLSTIAQEMTGISVPHISERQVTSILVPLPPLDEQQRIVALIASLLPLVDEYGNLEDARERLDAGLPERLRKSILQEAVQGRLVPQDPSDEPASALLGRIRAERAALVRAGKLKAPKGGESVIYRGSDGGYYEKRGNGEPVCIDDEIPFDIPESWEWVRLGSIVLNRVQVKPASDFCYIDIGSIDNSRQRLNDAETVITAKDAPSRARKPVAMGDVLYSTVRPYLHNACIVNREFSHNPIASTGFAAMACPRGLNNKFLLSVLLSPYFDTYANDNENSKGVAYPAINDAKLYMALIPLPPENEQLQIVNHLDSLLTNQ